MSNEELIAELRDRAKPLAMRQAEFVEHALAIPADNEGLEAAVTMEQAADRLQALTQPLGKVSDEMFRVALDAFWKDVPGKSDYEHRLNAALEAAQLPARPKVKPLRWTVSEVFGARKIRGSGPFGEWCAFTIDGLTDQEVSEKKAKYQAGYERTILSAMEGKGHE